ncbi:MAG TPA: hypothetical protein PKC23_12255 [Candidatus Desulfobacillus sp.]|nr:hypothetical protein [Candidatus Desulfobacillus sp.]
MTLRRFSPFAPACALLLSLLFSGCEPAIVRMSEYQKNIKSYMEYWTKDGMTAESRVRDWVACGGQPNGNFSLDSRKRLPGEEYNAYLNRLEAEFERCMIRNGYRYTGNCSSDYMKASPLCGAP